MPADRAPSDGGPPLPRWLYRALWAVHRSVYALSGGRLGLRSGGDDRLGTLRLTTVGRRSGQERATLLYFLPAGAGFAVVASNAGASHPPAWWQNLQSQPDASVDVPGRSTRVRARTAGGEEYADLWRRFVARLDDYRRYAQSAGREIPIVILEPADRPAHARAREDGNA